MATTPIPYISANPGDLITAEIWNNVQVDVKQDIANQVAAGIASVKDVDHAGNADKLGGMTLAELTKYILDQAFAQLPKRTGYMQVLCNLEWANNAGVDKIIQHNLKSYPLVDIYQLNFFPVVCAKNDKPEDATAEWVLFYLYHADERRLRIPGQTGAIDIETDPKSRILWKALIDQFVNQKLMEYTDDTTLDDLEVDFWKAMFKSPPNDEFDPDSYCHSPWFEKCCGEKRTVGDLKKHGDFDDIYLKIMPQKTAIYAVPESPTTTTGTGSVSPAGGVGTIGGGGGGGHVTFTTPNDVLASQLDFDSIALQLLDQPTISLNPPAGTPPIMQPPPAYATHLPLLVLLKV